MKWLDKLVAALPRVAHPLATLGLGVLVLFGEPQCAGALARLGLVPLAAPPLVVSPR